MISYDMPWNPQRVVQRNGRVIRLLSPHDEVFLTTMLPEPGDLEELLRLETLGCERRSAQPASTAWRSRSSTASRATLRQLCRAARGRAIVELLRGRGRWALGRIPRRVFCGRSCLRAQLEGELARVEGLPWGIGAAFRQTAGEPLARGARRVLRDAYAPDGRCAGRVPLLAIRGDRRTSARRRSRDAAPHRPRGRRASRCRRDRP